MVSNLTRVLNISEAEFTINRFSWCRLFFSTSGVTDFEIGFDLLTFLEITWFAQVECTILFYIIICDATVTVPYQSTVFPNNILC